MTDEEKKNKKRQLLQEIYTELKEIESKEVDPE